MNEKKFDQPIDLKAVPTIDLKGGAVPPKLPVSPTMERRVPPPDKSGADTKK